ncbi:MAG: hypothetical protein IJ996_00520 [Clostridia bacterium]|nr:hypothetical protein [Clostridia bacterium]
MQETIQHEKYGTITYRENAWSGKKEIVFNETLLLKKEKNVYIYKPDENTDVTVKSKGSFLTGVTLDVEGESIKVIPAPKWYEVVCSVLIFMFTVIWGNSVYLCSILPIVGGAIGGGISGGATVVSIFLMKKSKTIGKKLLMWLITFVVSVMLCALIGFGLISLLK